VWPLFKQHWKKCSRVKAAGERKLQPQCRCYTSIWGPEEQAAFKNLQAAIMESMTLAFSDPDRRISVLTDASHRYYAGLVTQIDEEQLYLAMEVQDHQPLALLSGEFKGAQLRWTVPEKEGFAIVDTVTKVKYLSPSHDKFSVLSDHLNLT
jgi:RNase H-like domain found in reverse transcriptase